jgi:predicted transcriptional regulator
MSTKPITFTAIMENLKTIDEIAASRKRSRSFIINEAIEKFIEHSDNAKPKTTRKAAGKR